MLNLYQSNFAQFPLHLVGDYNIDILKHLECASVQNFTNLMFSFNLNPIIRRPTRISNFSATLLDHMWTNDVHVKNSGIIRSLVTDHYSVFSIIEVETESTSFNSDMITYRNMSTSNKLLFRNKLSLISWESLGIESDGEDFYNSFYDIIFNLYDECFPLCHRRVKVVDSRKPYINEYIRGLIKEKHRLQK